VRDLWRALAHYASLGFDVQPYAGADEYGFAERDAVSLHLSLDTGHDHEDGHDHEHVGTAYLYVDDADALYDERARAGIDVTAMTDPDVGVWRVGRGDGPDWAARWFPARRPLEAVAGDAEILTFVAARGFPAERCAAAEPVIPEAERDAYAALRAEIEALDTAAGLPAALTHPDFVLANVVATPESMVLVDWAGAGWGPRVWSLAFLLYAEGAKDLRRVDVVCWPATAGT
jgi:hypothetical protein